MASTYSTRARFELQATGENSDTWGTVLNTNVIQLVDDAIAAYTTIELSSISVTLTQSNGASDQARSAFLELHGTLTSNVGVVIPSISKGYIVRNNTTGAFGATVKTLGGTGVSIAQSSHAIVVCDGVSVRNVVDATGYAQLSAVQTFTNANTFTSATTLTGTVSATNLVVFTSLVDFRGANATTTIVSITGVVTINGQINASKVLVSGVSAVTSSTETGYSAFQYQQVVTLTAGTSVTWDLAAAPVALLSLAQDTSISCVNARVGGSYMLVLAQVTGSHLVTWPTFLLWPASAVPVLTTTASASDVITTFAIKTGTLYGTATLNFK